MELSYWEYEWWLAHVDFTIIGSGIVGLNCAVELKKQYPKARVLVLERGTFPAGASTKNAGFACYGSLSEILADLEHHSEEEVQQLARLRFQGIRLLRDMLGDKAIGYEEWGGHEIFLNKDAHLFEKCMARMAWVNALLKPIFGEVPFHVSNNTFEFKEIGSQYISHKFEGQINSGKMMRALIHLALKKDVLILNATTVHSFEDLGNKVQVITDTMTFNTGKLFIATNGFAGELLKENIRPARAQVLITKPIPDLKIKGCFHFDEGYYYFRNIHDRILFGGGRNLDFKNEETSNFGTTEVVQVELERLLKKVILPQTPFEIAHRWSGIMGVGPQKMPILKSLSPNVCCGVRLGGMGIAIGSQVGKDLAHQL